MFKTRKLLVGHDPTRKSRESRGDFLIPAVKDGAIALVGMRSRRAFRLGAMVFIGTDVSRVELIARAEEVNLRSRGFQLEPPLTDEYLEALQAFKIGNVLEVDRSRARPLSLTLVLKSLPPLHAPNLPK